MPALPVVMGFGSGILIALILGVNIWVTLSGIVIAGVLMFVDRHWWSMVVVFAILGALTVTFKSTPQTPSFLMNRKSLVVGRVESARYSQNTMGYIVRVSNVTTMDSICKYDCDFKMKLTVDALNRVYRPGDIIVAYGNLKPIDEKPDVPDKTDYNMSARMSGATSRMWVPEPDVRFIRADQTFFEKFVDKCHRSLTAAIVSTGVSSNTAAFLLAVLGGDDAVMTDDVENDFRTTGLAHVLAISGLHLSILVSLVMACLMLFKALPGGRYIYYGIPASLGLFYAIISGMSPSACRAAVMIGIYLLGRMFQWRTFPYNTLCITVFIWLLINPMWILSPGFQLSTLAALALIWLNDYINRFELTIAKRRVIMVFAVPITAVAATSVLTLVYFHEFPIWFLPANIIAGILIVPILMLGAVLTLCALCGVVLSPLAWVEDLLFNVFDGIVGWFADIPGGVITNIYLDVAQILLWIMFIFLIIWFMRMHKKPILSCGIGTLCILIFTTVFKPIPQGDELYITTDKRTARIVIRHNDKAMLFFPALSDTLTKQDSIGFENTKTLIEEEKERALADYKDFLGKRRIDDGFAVETNDFNFGPFVKQEDVMIIGNKVMVIANTNIITTHTVKVDYLLICGSFKGDVVKAAELTKAAKILIAADINKIRCNRYIRELEEAGIPCQSLAETPFSIVL